MSIVKLPPCRCVILQNISKIDRPNMATDEKLRIEHINKLRPRQNGRHFADDMFKCIFLNETVWIPIEISLKFVPKGPFNNNPALFQIMAWRRPGDKPLYEPMLVSSLTHICVTRPQWVNSRNGLSSILLHVGKNSIHQYDLFHHRTIWKHARTHKLFSLGAC